MGNRLSGNTKTLPRVVVLTPVYNEEAGLPLYEKAVRQTLLSRKDYDVRVLFIDDGSMDESWQVIKEISSRDSRFSGIRLSRNFGSHIALSAGFQETDADAICTLACDLQDPPEVIIEFLREWKNGHQIVWGKRKTRQDTAWRVAASGIFYKLIKRFAMPRGSRFTTGSFLLVDRKVAECVRQFGESNRITFALVAWTGFAQAVVPYDRKQRQSGQSGWSFSKMIKAMYDTFIGFSPLPIRLMSFIGMATFVIALCIAGYVLYSKAAGRPLPGWTGLMLTLSFFFGIQFLLMGITGEYLYRIYSEVIRRPLYFISDTVNESPTTTAKSNELPPIS